MNRRVTSDDIYGVVSIWAAVVETSTANAQQVIGSHVALRSLAAISGTILRNTAAECFQPDASTMKERLPIEKWLTRAMEVGSIKDGGGSSPAHIRARAIVAEREANFDGGGFSPQDVQAAFKLLRARASSAVVEEGFLRRRLQRWRTPPTQVLIGAPVARAGNAEIAIVAILSATTGVWTFSSSPGGQMFTHPRRGYSDYADRTHVDGLSDIIDGSSDTIAKHRNFLGGRIFVTRQFIECAHCKMVIAWLGEVGVRTPAFGACSDPAVQRSLMQT